MIGHRVPDDIQQLGIRTDSLDAQLVQELDHETGEPGERTGNPGLWVNLDEDALGSADEDLKFACLVQRAIQEGKQALVGDVRAVITDFLAVLPQDALVVITVEKVVPAVRAVVLLATTHLHNFKGGTIEDDY